MKPYIAKFRINARVYLPLLDEGRDTHIVQQLREFARADKLMFEGWAYDRGDIFDLDGFNDETLYAHNTHYQINLRVDESAVDFADGGISFEKYALAAILSHDCYIADIFYRETNEIHSKTIIVVQIE